MMDRPPLGALASERTDFVPWPENFARAYREQHMWLGKPLGDLLRQSASAAGSRTAIIHGDRRWSYRELDDKADQLAAGLVASGIGPGAHVVVQMPNCGEFFELLFALLRIGAAPVLALPSHRYSEICYFCQHTNALAYFACAGYAGFDYRSIGRKLLNDTVVKQVFINGDAAGFTSFNEIPRCAAASDSPGVIAAPEASSFALFQLSGGTTGTPKLIPRSHDDYYYSVRASAMICGLKHSSVYLAVLPVMHNFPLSSPGALGILWAGGTLVLAESGAPDEAFPLIEKHRVTITAMVPPLALVWLTAYENVKASGQAPDLSSLEVLQVGGAKFSEIAARRITPVLGCTLQQVFGMAEGLVNYTRLTDDLETIATTQGRPISSADEILILDDNDCPVTPGSSGHLLVRGPYTIRGYYRAQEHNAKTFTVEGFYRTGDLVRITPAGYLIVEGRAKDQINRGGEKIAAAELENHLLAHPQIHDAAVVAMPDPYLGERSCAFIVVRPGTAEPLKAARVLRFLRERELAAYKIPDRIEFIAALPQTKLGKVDKKTLRELIAAELTRAETV